MAVVDADIATKHIQLSLQIKEIAQAVNPNWKIYIATYTSGGSGQSYQRIEETTKQEYWSLKAWTPTPPHKRLKDPDIVICASGHVKALIEVKWAVVPGRNTSDVLLQPQELDKMLQLTQNPALCRVRGPAVKDGQRFRSARFRYQIDYTVDKNTHFLFAADFQEMKQLLPFQFQNFSRHVEKEPYGVSSC